MRHSSAPAPAAAAASGSPVVFPDGADEVLLPMTRMRQGIAAQMTRALAAPHAYVHMEVDASALVRAREAAKREYQAREGISLSYVPFVIKAAVDALRRYPTFNAHWTDAGLLAKRHIHMGVAVAVDDGLLVPVVRDVDQLSISGLNRAIADVAARARAGKLRLEDYGGSTFTIDNTGWFGSNLTMPIINVPEVAILTMEAITKRAVVETPEGDVIAIRPVMNMVLAIDHRANDGAGAADFLRAIKASIEGSDPRRRSTDRRTVSGPLRRTLPPWLASSRCSPRPAPSPTTGRARDDRDGRLGHAAPPHPDWIKARMPSGDNYHELKGLLRGLSLNTVCEEAHCPNIGECWDQRTATIMILGDTCTRACGFCAVKTGRPTWFDDDEPRRVAEAIRGLGLEHVVVTSVAGTTCPTAARASSPRPSARCARSSPGMGIEVLIPDFNGDDRAAGRDGRPAGHPQPQPRDRAAAPEAGPQARPLGSKPGRAPARQGDGRRDRLPVHMKKLLMVGLGERDELREGVHGAA